MPKDWDSGAQAAAGRVREALSEVFGGGGVPSKEVFSLALLVMSLDSHCSHPGRLSSDHPTVFTCQFRDALCCDLGSRELSPNSR